MGIKLVVFTIAAGAMIVRTMRGWSTWLDLGMMASAAFAVGAIAGLGQGKSLLVAAGWGAGTAMNATAIYWALGRTNAVARTTVRSPGPIVLGSTMAVLALGAILIVVDATATSRPPYWGALSNAFYLIFLGAAAIRLVYWRRWRG